MKNKILPYLFVAIVALFTLSGCGDDDPPVLDVTGSWHMTQMSTDEGATWNNWQLTPTVVAINADGTYYMDGYFGEHNGSWFRAENVVTCNADGLGAVAVIHFLSREGNNAEMQVVTVYGNLRVRATTTN